MDDLAKQVALHVAGATVGHQSDFSELPAWQNAEPLTQAFIDTWAIPFYLRLDDTDAAWKAQLLAARPYLTDEVIGQLLGDFNWRTRQTGAFFAALQGDTHWIDVIGTHLLKSEVCYAGRVYAFVLAAFNTSACTIYLDRYLAYYLAQPDLWFDQRQVLEALTYLDEINGTNVAEKHLAGWWSFTANKPHWDQEIETNHLRTQLAFLASVQAQ